MFYENLNITNLVEFEYRLWEANNPNWLKDYKSRIQMESKKSGNPDGNEHVEKDEEKKTGEE